MSQPDITVSMWFIKILIILKFENYYENNSKRGWSEKSRMAIFTMIVSVIAIVEVIILD
jgi:hypothetical protein